jgi:F0F1-type ATP synthase epsilon subunit
MAEKAPQYRATFKISIMTPDALLYQNEVESAFLTGDSGEYELLAYHYPVLGILKQGNIILNWQEAVPIKFGIVRFFANDCIVLVEEIERLRPKQKKKEEKMDIEDDDKKNII